MSNYTPEKYQRLKASYDKAYKKWHRKLKQKVIQHYSKGTMKCICCEESIFEFLGIDHLDNNGNRHRKKIGQAYAIYKWLIENNFPDGYEVVCFNCNWGRSRFGTCPHKISH